MIYFLFFIGFILLIKGADYLVDGSASLAKKLKIPAIVIGLTIIAFGTSMPELIVNIFASFHGQSDIAVGNIVGSNIVNILLILGLAAFIFPLRVQNNTTYKEIPLALLAVIVVALVANDRLIDSFNNNIISRIDGFILLLFFIIYLYYIYSISRKSTDNEPKIKTFHNGMSALMIVGGLAAMIVGGKWIVDGASEIAKILGMSEAMIGLTIVAIGTSLPELATSAVAAYKKQSDIAVGNIIGSNIFNIFWILGLSAAIRPLNFSVTMNLDIIILLVATLLLFTALFIGKKHTLERWQGIIFIIVYGFYIIFQIYRG